LACGREQPVAGRKLGDAETELMDALQSAKRNVQLITELRSVSRSGKRSLRPRKRSLRSNLARRRVSGARM
jgi:hypothetical protein